MKFSIIIPIYNMEKYLTETLENIDGQEFSDFGLVLVDDGSVDMSPAQCDIYANNHPKSVVIHKPNAGALSSRCQGVKAAGGDYLMFCDADDFLKANALFRINQVIEENDADMVIFNADIYEKGSRHPFFEHVFPQGIIDFKEKLYDHYFMDYSVNSMCLKATRRDCFEANVDFSDFYDCTVAEDMLQSVPITMKASTVYYIDEPLYDYCTGLGVTHKCNPNFYWANRKINIYVRQKLKKEKIRDLEQKAAFHILIAAYAGTTQMKWAEKWNDSELKNISRDIEFLKAWDIVWNSPYGKNFSSKQRLVLKLLKKENFTAIRMLLKVRGGK